MSLTEVAPEKHENPGFLKNIPAFEHYRLRDSKKVTSAKTFQACASRI